MRPYWLCLLLLALLPTAGVADESAEYMTHAPAGIPAESLSFESKYASGVRVDIGPPHKGARRVQVSNCGRVAQAIWKYEISDRGPIYFVEEFGDSRQSESFCEVSFAIYFHPDRLSGDLVGFVLFPNGRFGVTEPQ